MKQSTFLCLLVFALIGMVTTRCTNDTIPEIAPVDESYHPDKPIEFPHAIHTEKGLDCKYCHNPKENGQKPGISTFKTCTNCHDQTKGKTTSDGTQN